MNNMMQRTNKNITQNKNIYIQSNTSEAMICSWFAWLIKMKLRFNLNKQGINDLYERNEQGLMARTFSVDSPLKRVQNNHDLYGNPSVSPQILKGTIGMPYPPVTWPLFRGG